MASRLPARVVVDCGSVRVGEVGLQPSHGTDLDSNSPVDAAVPTAELEPVAMREREGPPLCAVVGDARGCPSVAPRKGGPRAEHYVRKECVVIDLHSMCPSPGLRCTAAAPPAPAPIDGRRAQPIPPRWPRCALAGTGHPSLRRSARSRLRNLLHLTQLRYDEPNPIHR